MIPNEIHPAIGSRAPRWASTRAARRADCFLAAGLASALLAGCGGGESAAASASPCPASATHEQDEIVHTGAFAAGSTTVERIGAKYFLRFTGDETIEYVIDLDDAGVQRGLVRVRESSSDCRPMVAGGLAFRSSYGAVLLPEQMQWTCALVYDAIEDGAVVLEYEDALEGLHRRRHRYELRGKTLRIELASLDEQDLAHAPNYAGAWTGPAWGTESAVVVRMQGGLATPLVHFRNGANGYFCSRQLDLTQSQASSWELVGSDPVPGADSVSLGYSTAGLYAPTTAGTLAAPVREVISVVVTREVEHALVAPTQAPSPHRDVAARRTHVLLANEAPWPVYRDLLDRLASWGMDELLLYTHAWWSPPGQGGGQGIDPVWFPAADPAGLIQFSARATELGVPFGLYSLFWLLPHSSPAFDPAQLAVDASGEMKTWNGNPLLAESAILAHASEESALIANVYRTSSAYVDVQTYAAPVSAGGSDSVDQGAGSPWAKTLRGSIADRKRWLRSVRDAVRGPILGEGSGNNAAANMEWLWAGYCDSVQRLVNTGAGVTSAAIPADSPVALTSWPVVSDYEYRVFARLQANHGNGVYEWFFGPADDELFGGHLEEMYPLTEGALDRYRIYELSYGHASHVLTNGAWSGSGDHISEAELIREHYLMNALQQRYLVSPVREIRYLHGGQMLELEDVLLAAGTLDVLRDPRLSLEFEDGLVMLLNHAEESWAVSHGGAQFLVPEDGFLAWHDASGLLAFSAIPEGTGGARVDYCFAPGRYEFFDGRGAAFGWGGLSAPQGGVVVANFARGIALEEDTRGEIAVLSHDPPALVSISVTPDSLALAPGEQAALRAVALLANGAQRDVTLLLDWGADDAGVAHVDHSGAVTACAFGLANVVAAPIEGVAVPPVPVVVAPKGEGSGTTP